VIKLDENEHEQRMEEAREVGQYYEHREKLERQGFIDKLTLTLLGLFAFVLAVVIVVYALDAMHLIDQRGGLLHWILP